MATTERKKNKHIEVKTICCGRCLRRYKVASLRLEDHHYYVRPYSCTEGDYWIHSEYAYTCRGCGVRNRLLGDASSPLSVRRPAFKEVVDVHEEASTPFVNQYQIRVMD